MAGLRIPAIALAFTCALIVVPGAWPAPTLTLFNCDYPSAVNGGQIVGWASSRNSGYGWYDDPVSNPGSCGTEFTVPNASFTRILGTSVIVPATPPSFLGYVGDYQDSVGWHGYVMYAQTAVTITGVPGNSVHA